MIDTVKRRPEELDALWEAYNRLGSVELRDQLFKSYLFMVEATVRFFLRRCPGVWRQPEEMYSEAVVALLGAIDRFDVRRGVLFETFAFTAVRGAVRDCLRQTCWRRIHGARGHVYYRRERPFTDVRFPGRSIPDRGDADPAAAAERRDFFEVVRQCCPSREQQVLELTYRHCLSQREISQRLGVTQGYVSRLYRNAHDRIKRYCVSHS